MQANHRKAFNAMKAIGAPVIEYDGPSYGEIFIVSGESNYDRVWADHYEEFGPEIDPEIIRIAHDHGLVFEWIDPGALGVYEA